MSFRISPTKISFPWSLILGISLSTLPACKQKPKESEIESAGSSPESYLGLVQDLENNPRCYSDDANPLDMISPEVVKEGAMSIELLDALIKDSPSIPCQPHQPQEDNLIAASDLIDDPTSHSLNLDYPALARDVVKIGWKLGGGCKECTKI